MMLRRVLPVLSVALLARAQVSVLVGSAGCDVDDKACVPGSEAEEQVVREVLVSRAGKLSLGRSSVNVGGKPVWLAVSADCLFVTLADKDVVYAFGSRQASRLASGVASGGRTPVFASVANAGKTVLVANYHGPDDANFSTGSGVASFSIEENCKLTLVDVKPHNGSSVDPKRQLSSHTHSFMSARHGLAYACDLGMDVIFTYAVDAETGHLREVARTHVKPGSGPRHIVEHPTLSLVYVVNEMGQSVSSFMQHASGSLDFKEELFLGRNGSAVLGSKASELAVAADGTRLYATNRGSENTISLFDISSGSLTRTHIAEAPAYPRGMLLLDNGVLLVAGQSQSELWSFTSDLSLVDKLAAAIAASGSETPRLPTHPASLAVGSIDLISGQIMI